MAAEDSPRRLRIILGLMTFGPDESKGARITSVTEFERCLDHFQFRGYTEVDTARVYVGGQQEAFTAQARWKERGLKMATKIFPTHGGEHQPEALKCIFEESLHALETESVDLFYLHAPDRTVPFAKTLKAVDEMYREGKFLEFGLSNFTSFELAEVVMTCVANGWVRPTVYQAIYNAITRSIEPELIPSCRRYGLKIVVYNPLAGGLLSGRYQSKNIPTSGRFFETATMDGRQYRDRYFNDAYFEALALIEPIVNKHGLTLREVALRWIVHHSDLDMTNCDGLIVGISSLEQLKQNLDDLEKGPLPEDIVATLGQAWTTCKASAPDYWQKRPLKYGYDSQIAIFGH